MLPAPSSRSELVDDGLYWVRARGYSPDGHPDWTVAHYKVARRHWRILGVDHHWFSTRDLAEIGPLFAVEPPSPASDEPGPLDVWNSEQPQPTSPRRR